MNQGRISSDTFFGGKKSAFAEVSSEVEGESIEEGMIDSPGFREVKWDEE